MRSTDTLQPEKDSMSSRYAAIRPEPVTAIPGLALVRRLEGPAPAAPEHSARVLPRICLYALPALWGMLLQLWMRIAGIHDVNSSAHLQFLFVFSFAWIAAIECLHTGRFVAANREHTGAMAILKSLSIATGAAVLLSRLLEHPLPRAADLLIDCAVISIASIAIKQSFRAIEGAQRPPTRILLAVGHGGDDAASWEFVRKEVSSHPISGAILLVDLDSTNRAVGPISTNELVSAIRREAVDGVLISATPSVVSTLSQQIKFCGGLDTPVRLVTGLPSGSSLRDRVSSAGSLYLLNTGAEPTGTTNYWLVKRGFDIVFSVAVLVAGLPLFLLIAAAIKLSSNGGIFFVQDRVGWNGRVFRMYKFRTMHTSHGYESDTRWTPPGDARRTRVGVFLRKYSLDELPQFFNVLMGDMSVVGPRPERPFFVSSFRRQIDEYHRRHRLKVGITGWAQVNGLRGDTCIRTRLLYDLYYLQNWGLIFDLKIILTTVFCVFKCKNAY
jgi:exopolysaccharide biosynthesis polyprenyl glycosylphosphotransferase